jgi:cell division cycle protein 20 (cofactor of APC complex)
VFESRAFSRVLFIYCWLTPALCIQRSQPDRFIMLPDPEAAPLASSPFHCSKENSPAHVQRLAEAVGINPAARILTFRQAPPPAQDPSLNAQRTYVQPLYAREKTSADGGGGSLGGGMGTSGPKQRRLPTQPERVLDAPGMVDDYYLNLLAWSARNVLAVALAENTYVWNAQTGSVTHLAEASEGNYVCSLDWASDGAYCAIGLSNGEVELWDVEAGRRLRSMGGRQARVPSLSWNSHILSSGCQDGSIWHHDVRVAQHKVGVLQGHSGEVCGLAWRPDGDCIASGGNDNVVNIWDGRVGDMTTDGRSVPKFTKRNHTAAVKVGLTFLLFSFQGARH